MERSILCPRFEKATRILNKRWTFLIIHQLLSGPRRFCEVESSIPISGRLLSERLKDLESEGIIKRAVFPDIPVRIEYSLTDKGMALQPVVQELAKWSEVWVTL